MIPKAAITQWGTSRNWPTPSAIEQDLLLARMIVEINTHETSPAEPLVTRPFSVNSSWFSGETQVRTFTDAELVATKIRALYQRKKGRDLFDIWLGLAELGLSGTQLREAFEPYRPGGLTAELAIENLRAKLADKAFRLDLTPLLSTDPAGYDIDQAGKLVITEVLSKL